MQCVRIGIVYTQRQSEAAASTFGTLNAQLCFVKVGERFYESQSDARSRCLMSVVCLIVTLKDVRQGFGADAVACVGNRDAYHSVVCHAYGCTDAAFFGIFNGIREQIVQHGGYDFGVKVDVWQIFIDVEFELHLRISVQLVVVETDFAHKFAQIALSHSKAAVLRLGFSELQNLVNQFAQSVCALLNHRNAPAARLRKLLVVCQDLERTEDER